MRRAERRSCPFCACRRTEIKSQQHYGLYHWIRCMNCDARGPRMDSRDAAIAAWGIEREVHDVDVYVEAGAKLLIRQRPRIRL